MVFVASISPMVSTVKRTIVAPPAPSRILSASTRPSTLIGAMGLQLQIFVMVAFGFDGPRGSPFQRQEIIYSVSMPMTPQTFMWMVDSLSYRETFGALKYSP